MRRDKNRMHVRFVLNQWFSTIFVLCLCFLWAGAAILRVPILFGEVEKVEESAVTVLWDRIQEGAESCTIDHCQQRFPTYTNDVARVCRNVAERALQVSRFGEGCQGLDWTKSPKSLWCTDVENACGINDLPEVIKSRFNLTTLFNTACFCCPQDSSLRGIFHYSAKEQMTKYEIACAIADAFNLPSSHLMPVSKKKKKTWAENTRSSYPLSLFTVSTVQGQKLMGAWGRKCNQNAPKFMIKQHFGPLYN